MGRWIKSERAAQDVLKRFGVTDPPVPVERIVGELEARLEFEPYDAEMSGMLYRDQGRAVIGINSAHPATRQRFSIGHELGHLVLHRHRLMFVDKLFRVTVPDKVKGLYYPREEVEANGFAAALLMPEEMLDVALSRSLRSVDADDTQALIEDLARRFQVSPQAMEYRLANLGRLIPQ